MKRIILDRDGKYSREFVEVLGEHDIEVIRTPPRSPNCNAHAERFVRSIKRECLDRVVLIGERSLRRTLRQYERHYNAERTHQGIGNRLIVRDEGPTAAGAVRCRPRLGGLLRFYRRASA